VPVASATFSAAPVTMETHRKRCGLPGDAASQPVVPVAFNCPAGKCIARIHSHTHTHTRTRTYARAHITRSPDEQQGVGCLVTVADRPFCIECARQLYPEANSDDEEPSNYSDIKDDHTVDQRYYRAILDLRLLQ
jgi:hypothetical protein